MKRLWHWAAVVAVGPLALILIKRGDGGGAILAACRLPQKNKQSSPARGQPI